MDRLLFAIGSGGAQLAEAFVMQCMAGVTDSQPVRVLLMGAPMQDTERLQALYAHYSAVQRHMDTRGMFATPLTLTLWPPVSGGRSLQAQVIAESDRLLCQALFTREQAELAPGQALDVDGHVSAVTWASCLQDDTDPVLRELKEQLSAGARCCILAGLCDPSGSYGLLQLARWIRRECNRKPDAVLLLPVHRDDDAALCGRMLTSGDLEKLLGNAALLGMPEDCRHARDGVSLAYWCGALAALQLLKGREGRLLWRIPAGNLSWSAFGPMQKTVKDGFTALLKVGAMMGSNYGSYLTHALTNPSWIRDKMNGWYRAHFDRVRHMEEPERLAMAEDVAALQQCIGACAAWLRSLLQELPAVLQWADALQTSAQAAGAHYEPVLQTAGQLAWMIDEAEQSGLANEHIVHRYDMSDNEAEAAMRTIEELRDRLSAQLAEQEPYFRELGGRMTRALLQQVLTREEASAGDLRSQAEETARRIAKAALVATPQQEPKVAQARARLTRMERQVTLRAGRATRARRELNSWSQPDRRGLMPTLDVSDQQEAVLLFPKDWLEALQGLREPEDKQDRARMTQLWPKDGRDPHTVTDRIGQSGPSAGKDQLGAFLQVLWQQCRDRE